MIISTVRNVSSSREMTESIMQCTEKAGYKAIIIDAAVRGKRLRDSRNHSMLLPKVTKIAHS